MSNFEEEFVWRMIDCAVPSASKIPYIYNEYTSTCSNIKEEFSKKSIVEGLLEIVEEMKDDEKKRNGLKVEEETPEKTFHFDIKDLDTK